MMVKVIKIFISSGMIGRSWAMIFAGSGFKVCIYDSVYKQVEDGLREIRSQLEYLNSEGHLRSDLTVEQHIARIEGTKDLKACLQNAFYIQVWIYITKT